MWRIAIIALGLLSQAVYAAVDPIDALTTRLNDQAGFGSLWINGLYPSIHLSASASTIDVLDEAIKNTGFSEGYIKHYSILSTRLVSLRTPTSVEYFAVLLDSDLGKKIFLMRYESEATGWWTRFYDAQ